MKKLIYKISLFAGLAIMLVSCADDFLDKPVYGVLAADDYFKTEDDRANNVLNGIAWDKAGKRLFVTGKKWPHLFEVKPVAKK